MNSSAVKVLRPCTPLSLLDRRGNMTVLQALPVSVCTATTRREARLHDMVCSIESLQPTCRLLRVCNGLGSACPP